MSFNMDFFLRNKLPKNGLYSILFLKKTNNSIRNMFKRWLQQRKKEYMCNMEKFQMHLDISNESKSLGLNRLQSQDTQRICRGEHRAPISNLWETMENTKVTKEKSQGTNLPRKGVKFNYGIMQTGELEADSWQKF